VIYGGNENPPRNRKSGDGNPPPKDKRAVILPDNWAGFNQVTRWLDWPEPNIRKDLNPCRRAEAY